MTDTNNSKANDNKKQSTSKTDSKNVIDKKGKTSQKPGGASKDGKYKPLVSIQKIDLTLVSVNKIYFNPNMRRHIIH